MQRRSSIKFQAFPAVINWILGCACEDKTPQSLEERSVQAMSWAQPAEQHSTGRHRDSASEWPLRNGSQASTPANRSAEEKEEWGQKSFSEKTMAKKKVLLLFSCEVISDSFVTPWPVACQAALSGISQARILQWVAICLSRASFPPRDQTWVSSSIGRRILYCWATWEAKNKKTQSYQNKKLS